MLVTIDKRGSISLPASVRRELGFRPGTHLELSVEPGGSITLYPVELYRTIKLNDSGLLKLNALQMTRQPGPLVSIKGTEYPLNLQPIRKPESRTRKFL
jgi:AbrB family looped-hinge helix DNA binding protein